MKTRIVTWALAMLAPLVFATPATAAKASVRAELSREQCQAVYDRATSAARVLEIVGASAAQQLGAPDRALLYAGISEQLGNTPYVAADAVNLFCDASTLARVGADTLALEARAAPARASSDPSVARLSGLKRQLDALPALPLKQAPI